MIKHIEKIICLNIFLKIRLALKRTKFKDKKGGHLKMKYSYLSRMTHFCISC